MGDAMDYIGRAFRKKDEMNQQSSGDESGQLPIGQENSLVFQTLLSAELSEHGVCVCARALRGSGQQPTKEESRCEGQLARSLEGMCPHGDQLLLHITNICSNKGASGFADSRPKNRLATQHHLNSE